MKPVIPALLGIVALTSSAFAQNTDAAPHSSRSPESELLQLDNAGQLESVIAEYEAMVWAASPGERADMEDRAPRRWPPPSP